MSPEKLGRKARKLEAAYDRVLATGKEYRSALKHLIRLVPDDATLEGIRSRLAFDRATLKKDRREARNLVATGGGVTQPEPEPAHEVTTAPAHLDGPKRVNGSGAPRKGRQPSPSSDHQQDRRQGPSQTPA